MRYLPLGTILLASALLLPSAVEAQGASASPLRFGILAGVNSATLGGDATADDDIDRRTAMLGGVYLVKPLRGGLAFRPELLLSQRGAEGSTIGDEEEATEISFKLTYLDLPLLLQYEGTGAGSLRPHVYAGPSFGYKTGCTLEGKEGSVTVSFDCDDDFDIESFDGAGIVGGGIGFPLGGLNATVGARYQHGFSNLTSDEKVRNRVFSLYGSLEFGRR
jgi:hypothetical protein